MEMVMEQEQDPDKGNPFGKRATSSIIWGVKCWGTCGFYATHELCWELLNCLYPFCSLPASAPDDFYHGIWLIETFARAGG